MAADEWLAIEVEKDGFPIERISLIGKDVLYFGREKGKADIFVDHPTVSRKHALISHVPGKAYYFIKDCKSAQGTYINDEKVAANAEHRIKAGTRLRFAQCPLVYKIVEKKKKKRAREEEQPAKAPEPKVGSALFSKKKDEPADKDEPKKKKFRLHQIRAAHILLKHQEVAKPRSWRDPDGEKIKERTKEQAIAQLEKLKKNLEDFATKVRGETQIADVTQSEAKWEADARLGKGRSKIAKKFAALAELYSDCRSAEGGGDLGPVRKGSVDKKFEKVLFNLKTGEISEVFETAAGFHIAMRIDHRCPDF